MLDTSAAALAQPQRVGRPGDPCVMVIFGAAGDLTRRKLFPALYNLARQQLLSREFAVVGLSHGEMSTEQFRQWVADDIKHYAGNDADADLIEWFLRRVYYITGEFDNQKVYLQLLLLSGHRTPIHRTCGGTTFRRRPHGGEQPRMAAGHY
jgi:glucose-6-phosphate 1-dehydrogenase